MTECCIDKLPIIEAKCSQFVAQAITSIELRQTPKGKYQIRLNGEGKWINAEYDEQSQTIKYNVK